MNKKIDNQDKRIDDKLKEFSNIAETNKHKIDQIDNIDDNINVNEKLLPIKKIDDDLIELTEKRIDNKFKEFLDIAKSNEHRNVIKLNDDDDNDKLISFEIKNFESDENFDIDLIQVDVENCILIEPTAKFIKLKIFLIQIFKPKKDIAIMHKPFPSIIRSNKNV